MYKILGGDGKEYGPIPAETLRQWIAEGRANAQTQVQADGETQWKSLGTLSEFAALFNVSVPVASGFSPVGTPAGPLTTNPLALTGFILSITSVTIGLCCCYGFPLNVTGIILSAIGLTQIRKQPERYQGRGLAIAGIILGGLSLLVGAVLLLLGVALSWSDIQKEFRNL